MPPIVIIVYGCMDSRALNYKKAATRENGSCKFKKKVVIKKKPSGCFDGPRAGMKDSVTSKNNTIKAKPWCRIVKIDSCNQAFTGNAPIWCYMKLTYDPRDNCPD
jgi:hypothetical protein